MPRFLSSSISELGSAVRVLQPQVSGTPCCIAAESNPCWVASCKVC